MSTHSAMDDVSSITGEAPAAVLLVHLSERAVVHVNPVARQLAPDAVLPMTVDEWSDAAQLRDLEGAELSETEHPLSKVARSEPVVGQAVSAAQVSDLGRQREPLWVVALPMAGAPMLDDHALVVFLPLRDARAARAAMDAATEQADLRDRAVLATGLSFTVADARDEEFPLVWVNPAFTATTGYTLEESVGRNCRFLQGPASDPAVRERMRAALTAGEALTVTVLNYRKDGLAFWNQVSMSPVFGPEGDVTHYVGIQTDVTGRVAADRARDEALAAEQAARREAEEARHRAEEHRARLDLLADATHRLSGTLDSTECRRRLLELVVPRLADWAVVLTPGPRRQVAAASALHRDPARAPLLEEYLDGVRRTTLTGPLQELLLGGRPARRIADYQSEAVRAERSSWTAEDEVLTLSDDLGAASVLIVPLPGRHRDNDVMVLVREPGSTGHTDDDLGIAVDLGRRAGLLLDNARLYEEQHLIASALQRSLLPDLPQVAGLTVAARYHAGADGSDVGGDFYELIDGPGDGVALAIGDVMGHDVYAAAAMGHLKGLLRACAWDATLDTPAAVLSRVDELTAALGMSTMATVGYARLTREETGDWALTHSSAGHPPLLVRHPDGTVRYLDDTGGIPLGVAPELSRRDRSERLPAGSTVLAYTDGLVERRGEVLTTGLQRLADVVAAAPRDVHALCDHLLAELGDSQDDIALLAVHLGP
ncbi:PP2C family protein-serine/threonine phosphatase [Kineococcus rhizosphaerae]|uniref:PAS domain S-box-containing protein n=1 Tax=Kineococcus rhizosphaerae TaxID=559628 RepID=A0A2T0R3F2_9ACTN|nr:PP2C family protein-serine/threonine phosphatase [Kineococcus rhizosphaerae]PRY14589.1 PAS domain S-box-containing protein [Kineococcus rhizosphaerae]